MTANSPDPIPEPSTSANTSPSVNGDPNGGDENDIDVVTNTEDKADTVSPIESKKFDGNKWRERTRTILAIILFINIGLTQLSVIGYLFLPTVISLISKGKGDDKEQKDLSKNLVKLSNSTFVYVVDSDKDDKNQTDKEIITLMWTSQVTLIGGALGFYFASSKDSI